MANVSSGCGLGPRPKLRFPGFDEAWKEVLLGDIAEYRKQKITVPKTDYVSTENMLQNFAGITPYSDDVDIEGVQFKSGDTLFANIRPYLKKTWLASFDGACSTDVLAMCPNGVSNEFLNNIVAQDRFIEYVMSGVKGSKMPRGDKSHIFAYKTAIPSKAEQEKINAFLHLISVKIEKTKLTIEQFKTYKRGLLNKLFPRNGAKVPELRFAGFTGDWEQRKAKELCSITTGKSNTQDQVKDGKYPFFIRSDIPVKSNKFLYDCEAVITIGDGKIGKVFHYINGKFDLHQRCYKMSDFKDILGKYFFYFFSTNFYDRAMKMTAKATVDSVRLEMISEMDILYPKSIKEQHLISDCLTAFDNLITLHQHKCETLQKYKDGLMQQLFI